MINKSTCISNKYYMNVSVFEIKGHRIRLKEGKTLKKTLE